MGPGPVKLYTAISSESDVGKGENKINKINNCELLCGVLVRRASCELTARRGARNRNKYSTRIIVARGRKGEK